MSQTTTLPDAAVAARAVVVAEDGLRAGAQPVHNHENHLAHRVYHGHDADVEVSAVFLKLDVAENLYYASGRAHDEAGHA